MRGLRDRLCVDFGEETAIERDRLCVENSFSLWKLWET
jgi:hypothetical protein